jgi:hypothetical protein
MKVNYEFKYLTPEWICRARRTTLFLEVTGLKSFKSQSKAIEHLIELVRKHMQIDHMTVLKLNGELFILNEPYHVDSDGVQALIAQGLSVIEVPTNLSPYCGKFSSEHGALPWTSSYLISAKPTMTSAYIAERLELADRFAPAWNTQ